MSFLRIFENVFALRYHGTNIRTELIAGLTTFLTMSYILAVNPNILAVTGMDKQAIFVATCLAASFASCLMAFIANWPVGMAPSMGLNAFFAYSIVLGAAYSWQEALGAVFISGCVFLLLVITGLSRWLIKGVPQILRSAIAAGVGMFLAIIALKESGLIVSHPVTLLTLGDLSSIAPMLTISGFFFIVVLDMLKVRAALLIGILTITGISFLLGVNHFQGILSLPPSIAPTFLQLDIGGALQKGVLHIFLVLILVEVFDATGTLIGVGKRGGLLTKGDDKLNKAFFANGSAIIAGSLIGTSSTTAYVESTAGVAAGGRTGMTALVIAVLFLVALFFSPIILSVPAYATAPALLFVACLMMREFSEIQWGKMSDAVPAALTALMMPLTYSIANGLAFGFVSYVVLKSATGAWREIHPATAVIAVLFLLRFIVEYI